MQAHNMWSLNGYPRFVILNDNWLLLKSRYKRAFYLARINLAKDSDKLFNKLPQDDVEFLG